MMVVAESGCRLGGGGRRLRGKAGEPQASRRERDRRVEVVVPAVRVDEEGGRQWMAVKMDGEDGGADRATSEVLPRQGSRVCARGARRRRRRSRRRAGCALPVESVRPELCE